MGDGPGDGSVEDYWLFLRTRRRCRTGARMVCMDREEGWRACGTIMDLDVVGGDCSLVGGGLVSERLAAPETRR